MEPVNQPPNIQQKIRALSFVLDATRFAHGAVVGNPAFAHTTEPDHCKCEHGESIRFVRSIRKELYARVSESRKARTTARTAKR